MTVSKLSHAEQVEKLVAGGAPIIQLRDKLASPRDFYESAKQVVAITRRHNIPVIINDRVDIALAARADGVHLGQDDIPPPAARKVLGSRAIIGLSTHSIEQAIAAIRQCVDYIAIGPIFETRTKQNPDEQIGLRGLEQVRQAIGDFQLVAIGGITEQNLESVLAAGADSVAMIGAILSRTEHIQSQVARLKQIADQQQSTRFN